MIMAKVFENGRSQEARLPKESTWSGFLSSLNLFSEDFMEDGRDKSMAQERDAL